MTCLSDNKFGGEYRISRTEISTLVGSDARDEESRRSSRIINSASAE